MKGEKDPVALVGRSRLIDDLVSGFRRPHGGGALVFGRAGYGKTSLATAVVAALGEQIESIAVYASPTLSSVPFGALAPLLPSLPAADSQSLVAVLRELQSRVREETSKSDTTPLIVIDNAHALDEHSAVVLSQIATAELAHLLVLARPEAGVSQGITALWRDGLLTRHELPLLTEDEVHTLCVQSLGGDIVRTATRLMTRASGGNPAWLLALLELGKRSEQLVNRNGIWILTADRHRPDAQLVDLIRMQTIGNDAERTVLETVSLADPVPLAALLEISRPGAVDALEAGRVIAISSDTQQLVRPALPLYGEVIRQSVPLGRSIDLRKTLLQHVDLESSSAEDLVRNVNWALDCGATVSDQRLLRASVLANRAFDTASALRASAAIRDPSREGAAAVQASWAHFFKGDLAKSQRLLNDAAPRVTDLPSVASATLLRAQILLQKGAAPVELQHAANDWISSVRRIETAQAYTSESRVELSRLGSELLMLHARNLTGDFGGSEAALRHIINHPSGTNETRMVALSLLGEALNSTGRPESAATATTESLHALQQIGLQFLPYSEFVVIPHIFALIDSGRWTTARETATEYLYSSLCNPRHFGGIYHLVEGWILLRQGMMRSALRQLRVAIEALRESDVDQLLPTAFGLGAYAAAMSGDALSSAEYGNQFFDVTCTTSDHRWIVGAAHVAAARASVTNLSAHGAELSRLAAEAGQKGLASAQQVVLELLLRTGDTTGLHELVSVSAHNEGPAADVLNVMARALLARDIDSLLEAGAKAAEAHYVLIAAECAGAAVRFSDGSPAFFETKSTALRMLGERRTHLEGISTAWLKSPSADHPLTRRQKDIAALVLQGLSNRQIAEELSISHRTVEGHLYQMFTKLDISSRNELPNAF